MAHKTYRSRFPVRKLNRKRDVKRDQQRSLGRRRRRFRPT